MGWSRPSQTRKVGNEAVFAGNFGSQPGKGAFSTEPFVDHDTKSILVAGRTRAILQLLGSHVGNAAGHGQRSIIVRILSQEGNTKVAEHDLVASADQEVLRLDIAVNQLLVMGAL